jgi:hypothetical protein
MELVGEVRAPGRIPLGVVSESGEDFPVPQRLRYLAIRLVTYTLYGLYLVWRISAVR